MNTQSTYSWLSYDGELRDVQEFQAKFGMPNNMTPTLLTRRHVEGRIKFLQEELNELAEGAELNDLVKMADALIDLVYVAKGTVLRMGLAGAWSFMWSEVQRSNMAKVLCTVPEARGFKGLIKPSGWVGPAIKPILLDFGWDPTSTSTSDDPTMGDH